MSGRCRYCGRRLPKGCKVYCCRAHADAGRRNVKICLTCKTPFVLLAHQLPGPYQAIVRSSTFDGIPLGFCSGRCIRVKD